MDENNSPSSVKRRTLTTTADLQIFKGNDPSRPLSKPTRLESLKLIQGALRGCSDIELTLSTQRQQSHGKCLPTNSGKQMKSNRLIAHQTQS